MNLFKRELCDEAVMWALKYCSDTSLFHTLSMSNTLEKVRCYFVETYF